MNFLKAFGLAALKITAIVSGFDFTKLVPQQVAGEVRFVKNHMSEIMKVVVDVEAIGQALSLSGPQMLEAEIPKVSQLILDVLMDLNPKFKIADEAEYRAGIAEIANGAARVLKSGHPDGIETTDKT